MDKKFRKCLESEKILLSEKKCQNSEIGSNSETLTSNTRELVDLSFNQLSFMKGLGAEAPMVGVGDEVLYENGGYRGPSPPRIEKSQSIFFMILNI